MPEWNQDLSLYHAFRVSAVPHFQHVARMIGRDTMQKWLDSTHYGNMVIGPAIDQFWLNNSLRSPMMNRFGWQNFYISGNFLFDIAFRKKLKK
jgi:beta-lactamase class D